MAGADESGEEMQSGRTNRAEDRTQIWAQQENGGAFNGDAIFIVEAARDIEDDDFQKTFQKLHAVVGFGNSGGVGVVGLDESSQDQDLTKIPSVGVFARGRIGALGQGTDGPGLEGHGRRPRMELTAPKFGIGVLGRGGRQRDDKNAGRHLHGPGVVGIGGGRSALPSDEGVIGSAGVFGQGAAAEERTIEGVTHGPKLPGAGVVGRGGLPISAGGSVGAGIVGLAGGRLDLIPGYTPPTDTGVYGRGPMGVHAEGCNGPGVLGLGSSNAPAAGGLPDAAVAPGVVGHGGTGFLPNTDIPVHGAGVVGLAGDQPLPAWETATDAGVLGIGNAGRGGVFQSERVAQLRLVPSKRASTADQVDVTPQAIGEPGRWGSELPRDGRPGDLMATLDGRGQAALWFCIREAIATAPARWAQVLLGPDFDGRA